VWGFFCGLLRVWLASKSDISEVKKIDLLDFFTKITEELNLEERQFLDDNVERPSRGTGFGKLACDGEAGDVTHWNNQVPVNISNSPPQHPNQVYFDARNSLQNTQFQMNTARDNYYNPINDIVTSVHNLPFVKGLPSRPLPPPMSGPNQQIVDESQVYQEYSQDTGNTVVVLSYSSGGRPPSRRAQRHRMLGMTPYC